MRLMTSNKTAKNISRSMNPISGEDIASDDFMLRNGFREMTAKESERSKDLFLCAERSSVAARLKSAIAHLIEALRLTDANPRC